MNNTTAKLKPEGWFSRRHRTREAHEEAVAKHSTREDRRIDALERQARYKHENSRAHRLGKCDCEKTTEPAPAKSKKGKKK